MKKFLAFVLLIVMVFSLCACGQTGDNNSDQAASEKGFRVGYARCDITPEEAVPLGGFGNCDKRLSTSILRRLYVSCIAITDEQDYTVLLFSCDFINPYQQLMNARPIISQSTGVPEHQILINSSHTHAGPDVGSTSFESIQRWIALVNEQLVRAGTDAMADRKAANMSYGSIETENLNFIKHYKHVDADGSVKFFGDNFGTQVLDETTEHTTQIDQTMFMLKFEREGGKDVVFASWRAHPLLDGSSSRTELSSDYPGAFREAMELQLDCHFSFFQGAAGNNNSSSRLAKEVRTKDTAEYGALLAGYAIDCLNNNMTKVEKS